MIPFLESVLLIIFALDSKTKNKTSPAGKYTNTSS